MVCCDHTAHRAVLSTGNAPMKDSTIRAAASAIANSAIAYTETGTELALAAVLSARSNFMEIVNKVLPPANRLTITPPADAKLKISGTRLGGRAEFGVFSEVNVDNNGIVADGKLILARIPEGTYIQGNIIHVEWDTIIIKPRI